VSSQNVALVKQAYECFNREGAKGTLPFLAPDVLWDESRLPPRSPGIYRGHEGILELDRQNAALWLDIKAEVESVVAAGEDKVVASLRARGRGRFTGEEVELAIAHLWEMRGGKAVLVRLYLDHDEALEAAGAG
jgi:ketosteroid isomerase-like protein